MTFADHEATRSGETAARRERKSRRVPLLLGGAAAATAGLATAAAMVLATPAGAATMSPASSPRYHFTTLNNHKDLTFNQLLGINNEYVISGYFGSGMPGHPNKGYLLVPPYHQNDYINENFPHSAQTQVTGLNNVGNTVGFWANAAGANFGFYTSGTHFYQIPKVPGSSYASPQVVQLLGINDHGLAVGFYTNNNQPTGNNRGFTYNIHSHKFKRVLIPGAAQGLTGPSLTAAAINNHGEIAGFYVTQTGSTVAFVATAHTFTTFFFPHATLTQALGINDSGEVVGDYQLGTGSSAKMHGFTWRIGHGFHTVNDPHGVNTTTINGVNNRGDLVGFYVDSKGNTDGFLAKP
jgi:hypothetical protein